MPDPKAYNPDPMAYQWTEAAYALLEAGELSASVTTQGGVLVERVEGKCPYCGDTIHHSAPRQTVTDGTRQTLGDDLTASLDDDRYDAITVTCDCGVAHPGRPEKATGCGTTFRIEVLVE